VPVLKMGRHVVGVVSESDLLAAEDKSVRQARLEAESPRRWRLRQPRRTGLTAGTLMTAPAITIHPDTTIPGAARLMNTHHVRRLPVVDGDGKLVGIVSRRDLLSVFLRPDDDIAHDVRRLLDELPRWARRGNRPPPRRLTGSQAEAPARPPQTGEPGSLALR